MVNVTIGLHVDTNTVTPKNLETHCYFTVDGIRVTPPGGKLTDTSLNLTQLDYVTWKGISTDNDNNVVNINSIVFVSGTNVFGTTPITGEGSPAMVEAQAVLVGDEQYTINFDIGRVDSSMESLILRVDPKIHVTTGSGSGGVVIE